MSFLSSINLWFWVFVSTLILGLFIAFISWYIGEKNKKTNRIFVLTFAGLFLGLIATITMHFLAKHNEGILNDKIDLLEQKQQPRILSDRQCVTLKSELLNISGMANLSIAYISGNKESENLANQISAIFTDVGINNFVTFWLGSPMPSGITILSRSEKSDLNASTISNAFIKANIPSQYARGSFIPDKDICITVGVKKELKTTPKQ